jgi:hypothetical protein
MKTKQIVAYYRCSTKDQHYGINVQKNQMHEFLEANNNEFQIVAEFEEHQSGKNDNRIELTKAITGQFLDLPNWIDYREELLFYTTLNHPV